MTLLGVNLTSDSHEGKRSITSSVTQAVLKWQCDVLFHMNQREIRRSTMMWRTAMKITETCWVSVCLLFNLWVNLLILIGSVFDVKYNIKHDIFAFVFNNRLWWCGGGVKKWQHDCMTHGHTHCLSSFYS